MYLPVFFAAKSVSREICTTHRQYTHIHTNITIEKTTDIQIHTKIHAYTCNNTYIKQVRKKVHMLLIKCYICMYMYVCVLHVCYMWSIEINPYVHVLHVFAYMCIHVATFVRFEINPHVHVLHVLAYMCIHVYTCTHM